MTPGRIVKTGLGIFRVQCASRRGGRLYCRRFDKRTRRWLPPRWIDAAHVRHVYQGYPDNA